MQFYAYLLLITIPGDKKTMHAMFTSVTPNESTNSTNAGVTIQYNV